MGWWGKKKMGTEDDYALQMMSSCYFRSGSLFGYLRVKQLNNNILAGMAQVDTAFSLLLGLGQAVSIWELDGSRL